MLNDRKEGSNLVPEEIGRKPKMRNWYGGEGTGYWADGEITTHRRDLGEEARKEDGGFDGAAAASDTDCI